MAGHEPAGELEDVLRFSWPPQIVRPRARFWLPGAAIAGFSALLVIVAQPWVGIPVALAAALVVRGGWQWYQQAGKATVTADGIGTRSLRGCTQHLVWPEIEATVTRDISGREKLLLRSNVRPLTIVLSDEFERWPDLLSATARFTELVDRRG